MHARLRGPCTLLILHQIIKRTLFDEIAEQRPDISIIVTAFTVSEKSINTWSGNSGQKSLYSCVFNICTIR